ncbi:hypothetical protein B0H10DRAFT_2050746 [Mycena sp. CBHHK59/15]|nr:hypothetical protein B0H10DRAFT_2050746 [Mycena sp. CBHHK59/15]
MSKAHAADPSRSVNLLAGLNLPITVESHQDLTPSLLVGIVESLLSARLPIPAEQRAVIFTSAPAKVHCMKIFLGVLQADILQMDVGISNIDPRRLAQGADDETIFVGRLLCWYGRRIGLVSRPGADARNDSASPSTLTSATKHTGTSPVHAFSTSGLPESDTSVSADGDADPARSDSPPSSSSAQPTVKAGPRCIHEVPEPSLVLSPSSTRHESIEPEYHQSQNTTVRYTGYIELADEASEIAAFEARRAEEKRRRLRRAGKRRQQPPDDTNPIAEAAQVDLSAFAKRRAAEQERKVALMRRKADLLEQLARLHVSEYEAAVHAERDP